MYRLLTILVAALAALAFVATAVAQGGTGGETTPVDQISDFAMWGAGAGFLGSLVMAAINRARWSSLTKFVTFFAWCIVAAAGDAYFLRTLDFDNWVRALLIVFTAGQATYLAGKGAIKQLETATG